MKVVRGEFDTKALGRVVKFAAKNGVDEIGWRVDVGPGDNPHIRIWPIDKDPPRLSWAEYFKRIWFALKGEL